MSNLEEIEAHAQALSKRMDSVVILSSKFDPSTNSTDYWIVTRGNLFAAEGLILGMAQQIKEARKRGPGG